MMTFRKLAAASAGKLIRAYFTENTPEPIHDPDTTSGKHFDPGGRLTSYYTGRDSRATWRPDMPQAVAEALGINVAAYKLLAFVISSAIAAVAGALFAYYRSFVSVEAFSLFLTIQYVAMVIIGGMGSLGGAAIGALALGLVDAYADVYLTFSDLDLTNY